MALDIIRNAICFVDGYRAPGTTQFMLPKIKMKTEKTFLGGVDGESEIEFGPNALEAKIKFATVEQRMLKLSGLRPGVVKTFLFNAATISEMDASVKGMVCRMVGKVFDADPGDTKHGDKTEWDYRIVGRTYRLKYDGAIIHDFDPYNFVRIVDGVDQLADIRRAMEME